MSNGTYQRIICFGDTLPLLDKYFSIKEDRMWTNLLENKRWRWRFHTEWNCPQCRPHNRCIVPWWHARLDSFVFVYLFHLLLHWFVLVFCLSCQENGKEFHWGIKPMLCHIFKWVFCIHSSCGSFILVPSFIYSEVLLPNETVLRMKFVKKSNLYLFSRTAPGGDLYQTAPGYFNIALFNPNKTAWN